MEKLWCEQCKEFKDDVYCNYYGTSYYSWDGETYAWADSGSDGEDGDDFFCNECGEQLVYKEFKLNEWQGARR